MGVLRRWLGVWAGGRAGLSGAGEPAPLSGLLLPGVCGIQRPGGGAFRRARGCELLLLPQVCASGRVFLHAHGGWFFVLGGRLLDVGLQGRRA